MTNIQKTSKDRLIIALDVYDQNKAIDLINQTSDYAGYYKIGLGFLANNGLDFAQKLTSQGSKVFLDLKLFDISQTVTDAVARLAEKTQASIMTVHGDPYVVSAALKGRTLSGCDHLKIFAVTVLTSLDLGDAKAAGYHGNSVADIVADRAKIAALAGADGVIASAHEASIIKGLGFGLEVITPGIRSNGSLTHDQKRTKTPTEALKAGADKLVIGREITKAEDPKAVTEGIYNDIHHFDYAVN